MLRFGLVHFFPSALADGFNYHEYCASACISFPIPEDYEFVAFVDNDLYKGARFKIRDNNGSMFDNFIMH